MYAAPEKEVCLLFNRTAGFIENYYGFRFKSMEMLTVCVRDLQKKKLK